MNRQDAEPTKPTNPWVHMAIGMFLLGFAWYMHGDLTAFESAGGERSMHAVFAALYNLFGKWGVVLPLAVAGAGFVANALRRLARPRAA